MKGLRFAFLLLLLLGQPSLSAEVDKLAELERQIYLLQERVRVLEARLEVSPPVATDQAKSENLRNWRQLRQNMAESEVTALLGEPGKVDVNQYFFTWHYNYPGGGSVRFDGSSRRVEAWSEP